MSVRHVVLLTYGEPRTPAFAAQLAYSWRILLGLTRTVAPIPGALLPALALYRAAVRSRLWRRERYASPLEAVTEAQAARLAVALAGAAPEERWRVHAAYEFRAPLLPDLLGRLPADEPVDVIPMYAADSGFTHGLARRTVGAFAAGAGAGRTAPLRVTPALEADALGGIEALHVAAEMARRGVDCGPDCALVLAAHGTLLDPPAGVATGRLETEQIAAGIERRLGNRFGRVVTGWLNHARGGRWTEPTVAEALRRLVAEGFRRAVYLPFGFLADNAESQLEGRVWLRTQPALDAVHLPCLNDSPDLAAALAHQVLEAHAAPERAFA